MENNAGRGGPRRSRQALVESGHARRWASRVTPDVTPIMLCEVTRKASHQASRQSLKSLYGLRLPVPVSFERCPIRAQPQIERGPAFKQGRDEVRLAADMTRATKKA